MAALQFAYFRLALLLAAMAGPVVADAQSIDTLSGIRGFFTLIQTILNTLLPILVALAVIVFFWGLVKYIYSAGNEKARADGAGLMTWGVIALFVMVSIWGLVAILQSLFGIDDNAIITVPSVPSI